MYTLSGCPHCLRARVLLRRRRLAFREIDVTRLPEFRQALRAATGGATAPQILIDGEPIGGADQLARLDRLGVLRALAAGEPFPIVHERRHASPRSLARWVRSLIRARRHEPLLVRDTVLLDRQGRTITPHPLDQTTARDRPHDGVGRLPS